MTTTIAAAEPDAPAPLSLISSRPLLGVLMLAGATLLFACNDAANKYLLTDYNVPLVAAVRYLVHAILMLAILGPRRGRELVTTERTGLVIVRALCLVVATLFFGLALQRMPVAETTSIVYLSPILVVLLARPLLGESIGAVGWVAAVVGFAGMLLIVRPGGGLDPLGVGFVLCNVGVTVAYYLLSRVLARSERTLALLFYSALVGAICFSIVLPWNLTGRAPDPIQIALFLSLGVTAGLGHYFFTAAYRFAEASVLAPVTYLHLLWAGLLGWLVFGHVPEGLTIIGMVVVAASGVLVAMRTAWRKPIEPAPAVN
ncbi:MAG: DMT family transporter [Devosia sp.]|nr:DMT family transporter [Devosia sp.]